ncbi:DUF2271 domain-containing protein [Pseudomonas stutzeri]|uniref:DUF2271 domain-containing protein n=1 Tax=Stutzerimonas stutzeri TaxID=316 RepID=A0A2N8SQF3_STUST|nr:DUF2271 domain-containing protein [Stutzerimonas stutzeri]EQM75990.1 hypothetical protein L686_18515 [Stutzerimonas stutzeri MF28]MCQ4250196.1 DUF2271 domain-containing protein [Stutzerimonas stutzeri]PNG04723.1 DUF2271 domain-containing protein [Stutzerimonas stutzeri]
MRKSLLLPLALLSSPLMAAELQVTVEIPRLQVAEYHRPYVAIWLEKPDQSHVADLAVWYDMKMKDNEGQKWLKDLRQWWRRSGRSLEMPVDGISSATRAVGSHTLSFDSDKAPLRDMPPGDYRLVVEAAREVGGRELLRVPFSWPASEQQSHQAQGESELGAVSLTLKP